MNRLLLITGLVFVFSLQCPAEDRPRVFIFTDINIDQGDPDDRQSLLHLLWYADELQIEGIVPDRWNAQSVKACELALEAYTTDYFAYAFAEKGYEAPGQLRKRVADDADEAAQLFRAAASDTTSPLYVLIWGSMETFGRIMREQPGDPGNTRLITIGTGLMLEEDMQHIPAGWERSKPCLQLNWNGHGRNAIYNNPLYNDLWWLEINWTYAGMFTGDQPAFMFDTLSAFGSMGMHLREVVKNQSWAQYFRVGDTPSVLYVIDPDHPLDDPEQSSWAGKYVKPFPMEKPGYYTDYCGSVEWNYHDPCTTWQNHQAVRDTAVKTLTDRRPEMYRALLEKLNQLYR